MPIALRAAAHAGLDDVGQVAGHLDELLARLHADDLLEVAHHERERVRAHDGADAVDGVLVVGEVRLERRVHGLLEGLQPVRDGHDGRAEELHAAHVRRLLLDVDHAHVDLALEAEVRGRRGERDAVLAGAGLGDELLLAHVLGQQALAHAVVELVRAGVVEVLALEVDLRAAVGQREGARVVDRRGPPLEVLAQVAQLGDEGRVVLDLVVRLGDLGEGRLELRRQVLPAVLAEEPGLVGHRLPPRRVLRLGLVDRRLLRHRAHLVRSRVNGPPVSLRDPAAACAAPPDVRHSTSMKYSTNSLARPSSSERHQPEVVEGLRVLARRSCPRDRWSRRGRRTGRPPAPAPGTRTTRGCSPSLLAEPVVGDRLDALERRRGTAP